MYNRSSSPVETSSHQHLLFELRLFFQKFLLFRLGFKALGRAGRLGESAGKEQRQLDQLDQLDTIFIHAWCYRETHDF